eukprot:gene1945-2479_t
MLHAVCRARKYCYVDRDCPEGNVDGGLFGPAWAIVSDERAEAVTHRAAAD